MPFTQLPEQFIKNLTGRTIEDVCRRGKYLVLKTGVNQRLIVHLRMTGSLVAHASVLEAPPYAKIKFELTDGVTMWFCDTTTFGTLYLLFCCTMSFAASEESLFTLYRRGVAYFCS